MFKFENISVKQIQVLSQITSDTFLLKLEFIKSKYLRNATHFDDLIEFTKELDLIEIKGDHIAPKLKYKKFLHDFKKAGNQQQITQEFIVENLLGCRTSLLEYLNEYLSRFHIVNDQYEFAPSTSFRLKYGGLRNLLMDLEFLYLNSTQKKYIISADYYSIFTKFKESQQLTPTELLKILKKKEDIGKAAELQIVEFEKERLSHVPGLAKKIEHVAIKDVQAGYDIKSFEERLDTKGQSILRLIEVKAVSPWDYKFYWTRNEIEKAGMYKKKYFLYLLPVKGRNKFDFEALKIFKDPYSNIYKKNAGWLRTEELLSYVIADI